MDDITRGGPIDIIANDVTLLKDKGISFGVHLNTVKCERVTKMASVCVAQLTNFIRLDIRNSSLLLFIFIIIIYYYLLLGAPLSLGSAMDTSLQKRLSELKQAADRLRLIPAQDSLILLKASYGSSKLTHILHSSPCTNHNILLDNDDILHSYLINISNVNINDMQWQ